MKYTYTISILLVLGILFCPVAVQSFELPKMMETGIRKSSRLARLLPSPAVVLSMISDPKAAAATSVPATPSSKKKRQPATRKQQPDIVKSSVSSLSSSPPPKKKPRSSKPKSDASDTPASFRLTSEDVAAINPSQPFLDLEVPPCELRPSATLTTGQCFVWKALQTTPPFSTEDEPTASNSAWGTHNATEWVGTLRTPNGDSIVLVIRELPDTTLVRPLTPVPNGGFELKEFMYEYFQLQYSLQELYQEWSQADQRLATISQCIPGVRMVDQDPWECLISFICSSNNNIPRITKMLSAIRMQYGEALLTIGDETLYSFPSLQQLSKATDAELRASGMGYRAKYLMETMHTLQGHGGESYLRGLQQMDDAAVVQEKLCEFCGVGRKVADCVALFSLRQQDAIPVDTHVWNIALRDYDSEGLLSQVKSLTPAVYKQVGNLFRSRFPNKAGWAHSLLFVAELPSFRPVLPDDMIQEMEKFRLQEQARKKDKKKASSS